MNITRQMEALLESRDPVLSFLNDLDIGMDDTRDKSLLRQWDKAYASAVKTAKLGDSAKTLKVVKKLMGMVDSFDPKELDTYRPAMAALK